MAKDRRIRSSRLVTLEEDMHLEAQQEGQRPLANPHNRLTERELEVLELVADGKSNKEIARALIISVSTVKAHVSSLIHKLGVNSRIDAAVIWTKWSQWSRR